MGLKPSAVFFLALAAATVAPAFAQGDGDEQARQRNLHQLERLNRQGGEWRGAYARPGDPYYDQHGAGPDQRWRLGDRLPNEYRHRNYVVEDWRGHQLRQPPRGYQWVQSGSDYVLVAIATGVIADILLHNR